MKYNRVITLEVQIEGHVDTRADMEKRGFIGMGENKRPYRAVVNHPNGRMEWQWCDTLKEAKKWVNSTMNTYRFHQRL